MRDLARRKVLARCREAEARHSAVVPVLVAEEGLRIGGQVLDNDRGAQSVDEVIVAGVQHEALRDATCSAA